MRTLADATVRGTATIHHVSCSFLETFLTHLVLLDLVYPYCFRIFSEVGTGACAPICNFVVSVYRARVLRLVLEINVISIRIISSVRIIPISSFASICAITSSFVFFCSSHHSVEV